jgi:hypothetical protein
LGKTTLDVEDKSHLGDGRKGQSDLAVELLIESLHEGMETRHRLEEVIKSTLANLVELG